MEEQRKNSYDPNEDIVDRMWKRSKNSINLVIVVCNILVFLAVTLTGGTESSRHMMDCGAAYAPLIESGEYYRLFTSMFLHFGIQHLINNMLLLLFLGDYLERAAGKIRYLVIYLGGGLVGNLCSYLHELSLMKTGEAPAVSAGASGAIFSAVGAMLVLLAFRKGRLEDLTFRRMADWLSFRCWSVPVFKCGQLRTHRRFSGRSVFMAVSIREWQGCRKRGKRP